MTGQELKMCPLLSRAYNIMSYLIVLFSFVLRAFIEYIFLRGGLFVFGHVRCKDFVHLVLLGFLAFSCVFSARWSLSFSYLKKLEMLAYKVVFVTYPRVKLSCENSESSADVIQMFVPLFSGSISAQLFNQFDSVWKPIKSTCSSFASVDVIRKICFYWYIWYRCKHSYASVILLTLGNCTGLIWFSELTVLNSDLVFGVFFF